VGREGPTVQIASSLSAFSARVAGRFFPIKDCRSFLVAGAAAGVSAAFNTPLAGIAFALEEIAGSMFTQFKGGVMLCVIVAGITARAMGGNYLYFGHPSVSDPSSGMIFFAMFAGVLGGLLGGLFSRILTLPRMTLLPKSWWKRAIVCGVVCSTFAWLSNGDTSGSGYEAIRRFMDAPGASLPPLYFTEKFLTTVFSYLSGIAGGIFSPCLAIGAGMGVTSAQLFHLADPKACALIGMVAFFSGVVHAPLTAVIIIMEMTDQHMLIIPFMISAYLAHSIGKLVMPIPLYRHLAFHGERPVSGKS
jgi:H+/Cl- antiporter ClcA